MPLKIRRSANARIDQSDIWLSIAEDNIPAADGVQERLLEALAMLANHPEAGRSRAELGREIRAFPVGSYVIFYRVSTDHLDLLRMIHGARDITPDLFADD